MQETASLIEHVFLIAVVLFLLIECVLTARQILSAERSVGTVPEGFDNHLSLAAHRKAAAFTTETALANLVLAFAGAAFAALMTAGHGLTVIAAFFETLTGNTLLVEWLLVVTVAVAALLVEFPFGWVARYRVKERFGYQKSSRLEWLRKTFTRTAAGFAVALPASAVALTLFEICGRWWWLLLWFLWLAHLFWRWKLSLWRGTAWSRISRPVENEDFRALVKDFLAAHKLQMTDLVIMTRPGGWKHTDVLLVGTGSRRSVLIFAHAAAKLTRQELLALIALAVARVKHFHAFWRILFHAVAGLIVCAAVGWGSSEAAFFAGLGFSPALTVMQPGSHAGFAIALAIVTFPFLFFPLKPLIHFFSRILTHSADRFAAMTVGTGPLVRAIAKLHRDYRNTLTPSHGYSLFHYARPHAGRRVGRLMHTARQLQWKLEEPSDLIRFRVSPYLDREHPERTVLADEQAIRQRERASRAAFDRARAAAALEAELQVEHPLVIDDGLGDDAPAAGTDSAAEKQETQTSSTK
ncbi:M48 family metalloprotease [Sutterella sp.]|uniref:M48 family metalloprotease n=1 Tax=Sutterella sp. TaxID=1981025 RepID=UPI0026DEDC88|nr:M48 family metalloprotease [Sutterella sp.]MDO5531581.1 M48 family metalloprotease [Sutterella sp.]